VSITALAGLAASVGSAFAPSIAIVINGGGAHAVGTAYNAFAFTGHAVPTAFDQFYVICLSGATTITSPAPTCVIVESPVVIID